MLYCADDLHSVVISIYSQLNHLFENNRVDLVLKFYLETVSKLISIQES